MIFWKTYFSLAKSASVADFHLWRNCTQKLLLSYPTQIAGRKVSGKKNVDVPKWIGVQSSTFFQLPVPLKNAKNRIRIISEYSLNIAMTELKNDQENYYECECITD